MIWKKEFLHGAISAVLSSAAAVIYNTIYSQAFLLNFSKVLGISNIIISSSIGCLLMSLGYVIIIRWKGTRWLGWVNIVYALLSFASIAGVLSFSLPLDMESPEMFPGLAIPMHFFPLLAFTTIRPFFNSNISE